MRNLGPMASILPVCALHVAFVFPATAQSSCADWNTGAFFENATVTDVARCLADGADPGAWGDDGWTPLHAPTVLTN